MKKAITRFSPDPPISLSQSEFRIFQKMISQKIGLYFPENRKLQLEVSLSKCLEENKCASYMDYYHLLKSSLPDSAVVRNLSNRLSIRETSFFRNAAQFSVLKDHVIPELVSRKGKEKAIRIWSAGCATGQEPYSIAMTLIEALPDPDSWNISILATDMSSESLDAAQKGVYGPGAVRSLRKTDLSDYFSKRGRDFMVGERLKKNITFLRHNLVTQPFRVPAMAGLDIIFCRNVTIYFDLEVTKKVVDRFHSHLGEGGYFFIGHSETLWKISEKFKTLEFSRTYIYQKSVSKMPFPGKPFTGIHPLSYQSRTGEKNKTVLVTAETTKDPQTAYQTGVKAVQSKEFFKAISIFKGFQPADPYYAEAKTGLATLLADMEKFDEAIEVLKEIIRVDNLNDWAYYHLGAVFNRTGDLKQAREMFEKALYVNPENVLASYHQAEILLHEGNTRGAVKGFEGTLKILNTMPEDEIIPHSGDITPALLARSCHRHLEILKK